MISAQTPPSVAGVVRQLAASEKELYHDACVASRFLVSAEIASHAAFGKSRRKGEKGLKPKGWGRRVLKLYFFILRKAIEVCRFCWCSSVFGVWG